MAIAYINKTIPIPNIREQNTDRVHLEDSDYTVLGSYRVDKVATKKNRRFVAEYLTKTEYDSIDNYLDSILSGFTYFWLDEFGGNETDDSIEAVVRITDDVRVQFKDSSGTFHNDGRNIELEVIER